MSSVSTRATRKRVAGGLAARQAGTTEPTAGARSLPAAQMALDGRPHARGGGPQARTGREALLWLQATVGNAAVGSLVAQRQPPAAGSRRRPTRARRSAGPRLKAEDMGDVSQFILAFTATYADVQSAESMPDASGVTNPAVVAVETDLRAALELAFKGGEAAPRRFWSVWPKTRDGLFALADWAAGQQYDLETIRAYRSAVRVLEHRFVRWWAESAAERRADEMDVGNPDAAYEAAVAAELPRYARRVLELIDAQVEAGEKGRATEREAGRSAGDVASETLGDKAEGSKATAGGAVAVDSLRAAYALYTVVADGGELHEQLAKLKAAKLLPQSATTLEMVQTVISSTATVLELKTRIILAAGAKSGERLATLTGSLKGMDQLKSFSKAFGVLAGAAGVVASTTSLIAAIRSGKSRDIAEASVGLASSGTTLAMAIGGAGAVATAAVGGVFFLWSAMISMAFELGDLLGQLERDARARRALRMVDDARDAARVGRRMAAAWDEAERRKVAALDAGPDSAEATAVAELEAAAYRFAEELVPLMRRVLVHLVHWRDEGDVRIRRATRGIGNLDFRVEIDSIWRFTELCRVAFKAVDNVTRIVIKDAGGLPPTGPQF